MDKYIPLGRQAGAVIQLPASHFPSTATYWPLQVGVQVVPDGTMAPAGEHVLAFPFAISEAAQPVMDTCQL